MAQTAKALLLKSLRQFPQHRAIECGEQYLDYRQLLEPLLSLPVAVNELLEAQPRIGVLAAKTLTGYQSIAAVLLSGKTYVPLNSKYPLARNLKIIEQAELQLLVVDESCFELAHELNQQLGGRLNLLIFRADPERQQSLANCELIVAEVESIADGSENPCTQADSTADQVTPTGDDIAYLMFTSGSTGEPKGVPISDTNLAAYLEGVNQYFDFKSTDRFSQFFEFTFDLSMHDILVCWGNGACLCAADQMAQLMPLQFAKRKNLTVWFSVPSLSLTAKDLLRKRFTEFRLEAIRYSLFCGEALPQTLAAEWSEITQQAPVVNLYGPTEATIAFTVHTYDHSMDKEQPVVSIGRPLMANCVAILNDKGEEVETGELCLGGDQVFKGYWKRQQLAQQAFHKIAAKGDSDQRQALPYWYRTGDVVSFSPSGELCYHGRNDSQVQVQGFRVEIQEVEHVLREVTGVGTVAVIAFPVNEIGEAIGLTAFITDSKYEDTVLQEKCSERLPAYMVPQQFMPLDKFPHNASGKLDYRQLMQIAIEAAG